MIPKVKIVRAKESFRHADKLFKSLWEQLFLLGYRFRDIEIRKDMERVKVCWRCQKEIRWGNSGMERHFEKKHPGLRFCPSDDEKLKLFEKMKDHLQQAYNILGYLDSELVVPDLRKKEFAQLRKKHLPKNVIKFSSFSRKDSSPSKRKIGLNLGLDSSRYSTFSRKVALQAMGVCQGQGVLEKEKPGLPDPAFLNLKETNVNPAVPLLKEF